MFFLGLKNSYVTNRIKNKNKTCLGTWVNTSVCFVIPTIQKFLQKLLQCLQKKKFLLMEICNLSKSFFWNWICPEGGNLEEASGGIQK